MERNLQADIAGEILIDGSKQDGFSPDSMQTLINGYRQVLKRLNSPFIFCLSSEGCKISPLQHCTAGDLGQGFLYFVGKHLAFQGLLSSRICKGPNIQVAANVLALAESVYLESYE
ncbi:MAG: hypothetical protein J5I98_21050 [Phaeodactylibacter sp.]|nr:hypothetical protein [Phaeodactylibacter sp.]